jgi:hypothetical protein
MLLKLEGLIELKAARIFNLFSWGINFLNKKKISRIFIDLPQISSFYHKFLSKV